MHGSRCGVDKALAVQGIDQRLLLQRVQGQWRAWAGRSCSSRPYERRAVLDGPLPRRGATPQANDPAGSTNAKRRREFLHAGHHVFPFGASGVAKPSSTASFF